MPAAARHSTPSSNDLDSQAPFVPWATLYAYMKREFQQGDHVAVLGPTGSGKTHIALAVAEMRGYVLLVAVKPKDPLVDDAIARGYWPAPTDKLEIPYVDNKPMHKRVIFWPRLTDKQRRAIPDSQILSAERAMHRPRIQGALGYVRQNGHWTIVLDEGTYVCRDLGLQRDIDSALMHFRTLDSSIIILGQRPSWMGRYTLSSPTFLFLFNTNDREDRKSLGDVSGVDTASIRDIVGNLSYERHEFLMVDTRRRRLFRSVAPPR